MDVIGFLCLSLGNSTVQLLDGLGSRRACAYSEAGFSSQSSECAWGVYYQAVFCCQLFLWARGFNADRTENVFSIITCSLVSGETCPQSCYLSMAVVLSPSYTPVACSKEQEPSEKEAAN
jgi:hypothetical protein